MSLALIIGQPLATELARRWLAKNTNQPLLFYGPQGTGKRTLALEIAKALNCLGGEVEPSPALRAPSPKGRGPNSVVGVLPRAEGGRRPDEGDLGLDGCDVCTSCKKIASGNHPDVRVVDLVLQSTSRDEPLAKQQNLRIETILEERRRLFQTTGEGQWKVSIIDDVHRLTPDAANVLLKVLEEPPPRTAIFLLTPFRDRLFATVMSRCQAVRFKPLTDEEMRACLTARQIPKDLQSNLLELALGSPGRALHLSRGEQIESLRDAEQVWQALGERAPTSWILHAEGRTKATRPSRAEIEEKVQALLLPASRSMRAGESKAVPAVRVIQAALTRLRQNVQPALVYDYLLTQLSGIQNGRE